jgi:hypothetical protein
MVCWFQVDLLPEISQSPRILSDVEAALKAKQLKNEVDDFIKVCIQLPLTQIHRVYFFLEAYYC